MKVAATFSLLALASPAFAQEQSCDIAFTLYAARISEERTWQHVLRDPLGADYTDAYLLAASVSREYTSRFDGALGIEAEGNVAYHFGDQRHVELSMAPAVLRWRRFPWSGRVATSAAFGLGLSYATETPEVEVALEGDTHRLLIFWIMELTAGPADAPWAVSLRLHHRSTGWGLMGSKDGGMNAPGLGFRYAF